MVKMKNWLYNCTVDVLVCLLFWHCVVCGFAIILYCRKCGSLVRELCIVERWNRAILVQMVSRTNWSRLCQKPWMSCGEWCKTLVCESLHRLLLSFVACCLLVLFSSFVPCSPAVFKIVITNMCTVILLWKSTLLGMLAMLAEIVVKLSSGRSRSCYSCKRT